MATGDYGCGFAQVIGLVPKPLSEQVADLEKQLADLKAKQAAEAAEKAKTYGQRVAEGMVVDDRFGHGPSIIAINGVNFMPFKDGVNSVPYFRRYIAEALDKAHADGKAEQREADARVLTEVADGHACNPQSMSGNDRYYAGCESGFRRAADVVRVNK